MEPLQNTAFQDTIAPLHVATKKSNTIHYYTSHDLLDVAVLTWYSGAQELPNEELVVHANKTIVQRDEFGHVVVAELGDDVGAEVASNHFMAVLAFCSAVQDPAILASFTAPFTATDTHLHESNRRNQCVKHSFISTNPCAQTPGNKNWLSKPIT